MHSNVLQRCDVVSCGCIADSHVPVLQIDLDAASFKPERDRKTHLWHTMAKSSLAACKAAFDSYECVDEAVWDSAVGLLQQLQMAPSELSEQYEVFAVIKVRFQQ